MSEIEFECPYCDNKQYEEIEGMDEYDKYDAVCKTCNKRFAYRIEFSVEGYTEKLEEQVNK